VEADVSKPGMNIGAKIVHIDLHTQVTQLLEGCNTILFSIKLLSVISNRRYLGSKSESLKIFSTWFDRLGCENCLLDKLTLTVVSFSSG
jgi:hypothetical protein